MNYVRAFILMCTFVSFTPVCLQFPKLCREEVSIHVIQSREHILNTVCLSGIQSKNGGLTFTFHSILMLYPNTQRHVRSSDKFFPLEFMLSVSQDKFRRDKVDLITSARVRAVHRDHVVYTLRSPDGTIAEHEIPSNFVLWSTGIAMNPLTKRISDLLPNQVHKKAIEVDAHLRVKGAPLGEVYAIGDCATVSCPDSSSLLQADQVGDIDRNIARQPST